MRAAICAIRSGNRNGAGGDEASGTRCGESKTGENFSCAAGAISENLRGAVIEVFPAGNNVTPAVCSPIVQVRVPFPLACQRKNGLAHLRMQAFWAAEVFQRGTRRARESHTDRERFAR